MSGRAFDSGRHAGALVPLFSIPSRRSWGIGEISDLPRLARWLSAAGLGFVQLLPVNEMADGQNSPYSALSAMAIDPVFISIAALEEFEAAGGESAMPADDRALLDEARSSPAVMYDAVRALKSRALRSAFDRFAAGDFASGSRRAADFREFIARESWWLDD